MRTLLVEIMYTPNFRARSTWTRVAQQSAPVRKNSENGIAKRNIPVDFTSAISLQVLNKNISPRPRQHGEPQSEMFARVSALPIPACLSLLLFPSERTRVHNPRTRVGSSGPTHIRACRWDHVSDPEESGAFVGVIRKFHLYSLHACYARKSQSHTSSAAHFSVILKGTRRAVI